MMDGLRQPEKLMLAGDWHGNRRWAVDMINYAADKGVDTIVQLGDFGFWTEDLRTHQYLSAVNWELRKREMDLYWIDGNHEDHSRFYELNDSIVNRLPWALSSYPRITHLPRGFRWEWWGQTWMALGGAHSVDRQARVEGVSWWPQERLTDAQVGYAMRPGPVDVIVAHDAPTGVDIPMIGPDSKGSGLFPRNEIARATEHRRLVKRVVDAVKPGWFVHGHYHVCYTRGYHLPDGAWMVVQGLDRDESSTEYNTMIVTKGFTDADDE